MPYNTKAILLDVNGKPIPQGFSPAADDYKPLTSRNMGSDEWAQNVLGWGVTAGGVYVPLRVDTDGKLQVGVTGRNGATPVGTLQQITVDNTVKTLTPPPGATFATVSVETADIRFTKDGSTDPSTTVGQLLYVTDVLELESAAEVANFRFTRATATSGQITVSYGS